MSDNFKEKTLSEFIETVDSIINAIEEGKIQGKQVDISKKEKDLDSTAVEESTTEIGEFINPTKEAQQKRSVSVRKVNVTNTDGNIETFENATLAAKSFGINPTTVRTRCENNKKDLNNNIWSYGE